MELPTPDALPGAGTETPEALLDAIRDHPEWTDRRRGEWFESLDREVPAERLVEAIRGRFRDLRGIDGEAVLRLVDALGTPDLYEDLAEALLLQPDLPPERAWDALSLLDEAGLLGDHPELAGRWEDLNEAIDDDEGSLAQLAEQLEDDPEETWIALQGLAAVEPEVRRSARRPVEAAMGPGLAAFLRLLAYAHDPRTRAAAHRRPGAARPRGTARGRCLGDDRRRSPRPGRRRPRPRLARRRRRCRPGRLGGPRSTGPATAPMPASPRSKAAAWVDRAGGRGPRPTRHRRLPLRRRARDRRATGQVGTSAADGDGLFTEVADRPDGDVIKSDPELALGLLAGSLLLCGPRTTPALRYWLERTAGPAFAPLPFPGPFGDWDQTSLPIDELHSRRAPCSTRAAAWHDDSDLTYKLAEELLLRENDAPPDPDRDAGAFPLPVRASAPRPIGDVPADAPLDGRLLARLGRPRPRPVGPRPGLAALRPSACHPRAPVRPRLAAQSLEHAQADLAPPASTCAIPPAHRLAPGSTA